MEPYTVHTDYRRSKGKVIDEIKIILMRGREISKSSIFIRVNSFVEALVNTVCDLKNTSWCKKYCVNFHRDPTFR